MIDSIVVNEPAAWGEGMKNVILSSNPSGIDKT
jgi:hypothetical protein